MTKARDISKLLSTANGKIAGANLDVSFENISDTGTAGTKVASGTTGQRGSTAGQIRFNTTTGLAEYYTGTEFKIIDVPPTVTAVSPLEVASDAGGNVTFTITGSNFQSGAVAKFIGNDATEITASTTTVNSSSSISAIIAKSSFVGAKEPYDVRIINTSGLSGTLDNQINVDVSPAWSTASGTLATINDEATGTHATVSATDADGDTVSYSETGGTVLTTAGLTLNSSTGAISGNPTDVGSATTYSFNLRATANSKTVDRAFSIIINPSISGGNFTNTYSHGGTNYKIIKFTSTGNLILGASKVLDYLIIGGGGGGGAHSGGGGGAGGLVFFTNQTLSAGTYTATIGNGGTGTNNAIGTNGTNSSFNSHIALGGGYGGSGGGTGGGTGGNGGSGGGGARGSGGGSTTQLSTYGYGTGNNGASSGSNNGAPNYAGYAGGGTGGGGSNRIGGIGMDNFISSSTAATTAFLLAALAGTDASNNATISSSTGTLYIGGGGGGSDQDTVAASNLFGGTGGGGNGNMASGGTIQSGLINTGSGGGGSSVYLVNKGGDGGSGIIIIRYTI